MSKRKRILAKCMGCNILISDLMNLNIYDNMIVHSSEVSDEVAEHRVLAKQYIFNKRYSLALETCDHILSLNPDDPDTHAKKAMVLLGLDKPKKALEFAEAALEWENKNAYFLFVKANVLFKSGNVKDAQENINTAITLEPKNAYFLRFQAEIYLHMDDTKKALKIINRALDLDKLNAEAWLTAADIFEDLDEHKKAFKAARNAIRLNYEYVDAYKFMSTLLYELGKDDLAEKYLKKAKELAKG